MMERVQHLGALGMVVVALLVTAYLASSGNEQAQGAIIAVVASGSSFYLRGRVERAS